jgi:hypothetical protein
MCSPTFVVREISKQAKAFGLQFDRQGLASRAYPDLRVLAADVLISLYWPR